MQAVLSLRGISRVFLAAAREPVWALQGVDLDINAGEFFAIIGPSGCGKSTLMDIVAGLLAPSEGEVIFEGKRVSGTVPDGVGVVFQEDASFPWLSVYENVAFGLKETGLDRAEIDARVRYALEFMGLADFARHHPPQLSGGMRQRVCIARTLVLRPRLILLDEPFAALDQQTRLLMGEELLRLWRETGATVVLITHALDEAAMLADRVGVMSARPGRFIEVVATGWPRARDSTVVADPRFGEVTARLWSLLRLEPLRAMGRDFNNPTPAWKRSCPAAPGFHREDAPTLPGEGTIPPPRAGRGKPHRGGQLPRGGGVWPGEWRALPIAFLPGVMRLTPRSGRGLLTAEIGRDQLRIVDQLAGGALAHDLAGFHHIAVGRRLERGARILFDQEDRDAELAQERNDAEDLLHDQRRKAETGLVEHQQRRPAHQRAREGEHLPFPSRERPGVLVAAFPEARKTVEHLLDRTPDGGDAVPAAVGAEQEVVVDGHVREQLAAFRHETEPQLDAALGIERGDVLAVEKDPAPAGQEADGGHQQRRLAGAVRPDHGDDLAGLDLQRDVAHRLHLAVGHADSFDREQGHQATPPR